jgi:hypothetical protein
MDKANARVELWVARHALLDSGHSNQNEPNASSIEETKLLFAFC